MALASIWPSACLAPLTVITFRLGTGTDLTSKNLRSAANAPPNGRPPQ